jgi:hypothetical protein
VFGGETEQAFELKLFADLCRQLQTEQDLAEVLKYPFCTGEAEQIVLKQLEERTQNNFQSHTFEGSVSLAPSELPLSIRFKTLMSFPSAFRHVARWAQNPA